MRFSIITPTHKRADNLLRAVRSVQSQTYQDWEMIIVNDSPNDTSYASFASSINDSRIHYHVNHTNQGVNFSRNKALDKTSSHSTWTIFLDDDDYLAPDTLQTVHDLIIANPKRSWFITNRAHKDGTTISKGGVPEKTYSYIWDYLLLRRLTGDVTHAIETTKISTVRFPKNVKQGEEWFFFYQLGLTEKMFYSDHNSTISGGYDTENGLNFRKRPRSEKLETISILFYEAVKLGIAYHPTFLIYTLVRLLRLIY